MNFTKSSRKSLIKSLVLTLALSVAFLGLNVAFAESAKPAPTISKPVEKRSAEKNAISVNEKENCEKDTANCPKMAECPKGADCPKDMHCDKPGHCAKKGKGKMQHEKEPNEAGSQKPDAKADVKKTTM